MYAGSCHCGRVSFEVDGEVWKHGVQLLALQSQRLSLVVRASRTVPAEVCAGQLLDVQVQQARHQSPLLPACGCAPFATGTAPSGAATAAINVRCLETFLPRRYQARACGRSQPMSGLQSCQLHHARRAVSWRGGVCRCCIRASAGGCAGAPADARDLRGTLRRCPHTRLRIGRRARTGPVQFSSTIRARRITVHRWLGRVYLVVGVLRRFRRLTCRSTFGGPAARLGFGCLALAWLFTGVCAYRAVRARDLASHRRLDGAQLRLYLCGRHAQALPARALDRGRRIRSSVSSHRLAVLGAQYRARRAVLQPDASYLPEASSKTGKNAGVDQAGRDDAGDA